MRERIIRIFISSTYEDLKPKRNALNKYAFPLLEQYCSLKGWHFQAVDLRWGISNEIGVDQRIMQICKRDRAMSAS